MFTSCFAFSDALLRHYGNGSLPIVQIHHALPFMWPFFPSHFLCELQAFAILLATPSPAQ